MIIPTRIVIIIIIIIIIIISIPTFWKITKHGSTEDFSSLPYICTLLNCCLWTYYGIIKSGEYLVATVNGFGILARTAILAVILDVVIFAAAVITTLLALQGDSRSGAVGIMGAGLNIVMYSSPLSVMVPNGTGFLLGTIQLVLYAIYRNGGKEASKNRLEEGLQHEPLISSQPNNESYQREHRAT
ncbi:hypothetical protein V8G54_008728 [Vigna mungo]|uniref:Uncharacterized protein n=1 Tax=Vigna mungo TaxID=3915 RepID=A0AAQ3SA52_VIGMU